MKKICVLFLLFAGFSGVSFAQTFPDFFELSLTGISEGYAGVKRYCAKTTGEELSKLNNYIIQNNGRLTSGTLVGKCQQYLKQQNDNCVGGNLVIDKDIPANIQCQAYLGTALDVHNKLVDKLQNPGTYVTLYNGTGVLGDNRGVYSIVGVVPGNSNKIYEIKSGGEVEELPLQTGTPDMFVNIDTKNNVVGVHNRSVIYTQVDMTQAVSRMIMQNTGGQYLLNSSGLASQGDLDIKDSIGVRLYQTPEQQADTKYGKTYAHTNGVVFEGKVVNFEWLGHYIFGARKGSDKLAPGFVYDVMADREQATTSANTSGQGQTDSDFHKDVAEQARSRYSGDSVVNLLPQYIDDFKNVQTSTEIDAYNMASDYVKSVLGDLNYVKCWGVCGFTGNDVVTCQWSANGNNGTTNFKFDDICNDSVNYTSLSVIRDFESVQTRSVYEAILQAEKYIKTKISSVQDLVCDGDCDLAGDDKIYCFYKKDGVKYKQEFIFDDICD